jgi:hypothetical protein
MAEQTLERTQQPASHRSRTAMPTPSRHEALRQARSCFESADRRLRKGEADEVLRLLQLGADLLELALRPAPSFQGAE